jgi:hypothetical protein
MIAPKIPWWNMTKGTRFSVAQFHPQDGRPEIIPTWRTRVSPTIVLSQTSNWIEESSQNSQNFRSRFQYAQTPSLHRLFYTSPCFKRCIRKDDAQHRPSSGPAWKPGPPGLFLVGLPDISGRVKVALGVQSNRNKCLWSLDWLKGKSTGKP